jgi:hypothetical protein
MKHAHILGMLVLTIACLSAVAALAGIVSDHGPGEYEYESIRGENVTVYGKGFYQHMPADVAVQGIAQDYVTLLAGIPLLLVSFLLTRRGSVRGRFVLTGTLGYFTVTYVFYLCMAMYNELFLLWAVLASASFYAFALAVLSFDLDAVGAWFGKQTPHRLVGGFLILNAVMIGAMWLGVVVPPLLDGSVYPKDVYHFTTLIVQGLDLSILLPASFIAGYLFVRRNRYGLLVAPAYVVFLALLMTALSAKVIGMHLTGVDAGPAIVIIPFINSVAVLCALLTLKNVRGTGDDPGPVSVP